jgi:hypothetical protein
MYIILLQRPKSFEPFQTIYISIFFAKLPKVSTYGSFFLSLLDFNEYLLMKDQPDKIHQPEYTHHSSLRQMKELPY